MKGTGIGGNTILKWIFRKWDQRKRIGFNLGHHIKQWQALVNAVINLRLPYRLAAWLNSTSQATTASAP